MRLYDYVTIEMEEVPPGADHPVRVQVVAQVYRIERESLGLTPEHPWPVVQQYNLPDTLDTPRAYAKILGYKWRGQILRPRNAPPVGSWVYQAPDDLLRDFYSVEARRALHIGYLISRPSVPAYLDVEGIKRHLAIIAATGSGKTWTSVVLIEELLRKNATILVIDPHGEYVAMKESACRRAREFCGRIRVVKANAEQEGDILYRVDLSEIDGVMLADLAGIPRNATRVRDVVINAKKLADVLAKYVDKRFVSLSSIRWLINAAQQAVSETKGAGNASMRQNLFRTKMLSILRSRLRGLLRGGDDQVSAAIEQVEKDPDFSAALSQLYNVLNRSIEPAFNAVRYLASLERVGIYSTSTIPLDDLLSPGTATVVNLAGLPDVVQDHVVSSILERVFQARVRYVRRLQTGEKYEYPVVVIVEEAHRFIPARRERVETRSLPIATTIATEGRKFGVFLGVITQRPSRIDQDVLSQAQTHIILRIVNVRDQQAVRDASEQLSQDLFENLPGLNPGEAIIVGPMAPIPMMVRVRERLLEYSGTDISVVEEWGRAPSIAEVRRIEERLAEVLSDILVTPIDVTEVRKALENLIGVTSIPHRVYRRALTLVVSNRVTVYRYDPRNVKVYGRADDYDVEVSLWGAYRRCDCGVDSTEDEDAICEHITAVVIQAALEGFLSDASPVSTRGSRGGGGDELLDL